MSEMDEAIVREFLVESRDNLDQFERGLVELESNPAARGTLDTVFRAIHSIKGATGFLGLSKLGAISHAGETLLGRVRDGRIAMDAEIATALLALVDCIRQMLVNIERTGAEGDEAGETLIARLVPLQEREEATSAPAAPFLDPPEGDAGGLKQGASNIRVAVTELDTLMNLVGELVTARNELLQHSVLHQDPALLTSAQRLNIITTQLQDGIMKTRMQPIDHVWNKFPRAVRDAAIQCGKKVRLDMEGRETELDKTLIEAIRDPLMHLLRNAIGHGIERPERRVASGKPAEGRLVLRAFHAEGQVHIEVSDDGAGIDVAALRAKALERGVIAADRAQAISEQDTLDLIFLPGLSTAREVTSMSGRGVGMDVVKTNIEQIGGKVSVHSQLGTGTTIKIRIPLTLAIMPVLQVTARGDRYAIPQASVLELVRLEGAGIPKAVQQMGEAAVYRLRGSLIPLISLDGELWPAGRRARLNPAAMPVANIVVLQAEDRTFGLLVDDINDTQEIVVKPLGAHLRSISLFAGATIMGDGRVALILDVPGLALHSHVVSELRGTGVATDEPAPLDTTEETESLLMLVGDDDARMAVPLSDVMRLEAFDRASLESVGGETVVQYFGDILRLVAIGDLLPERRRQRRQPSSAVETSPAVQTVIYEKGGHRVGLIVNGILDAIELPRHLRPATRFGVRASMVIGGRVTEILDLNTICAPLVAKRAESGAGMAQAVRA
ncbi:MAG TPA: chemotaxis protein CheA [Vicinamibacterales bacterium]|jgi:two-component system chemotaxis sensor kinase CheA|nr:chemotaxis protein CheA [Vicinamibacterales bacterium]